MSTEGGARALAARGHSERSEESGSSRHSDLHAAGGHLILRFAQEDNGSAQEDEGRAQDEQAEAQESKRSVIARIWQALREVEDPEIPVSLVDMGLIVAVDFDAASRTARLTITYTAMGCPAMEMIQDDIRARLLRGPGVEAVEIEVVWDPVWSRKRLSESARATMRELGIAV